MLTEARTPLTSDAGFEGPGIGLDPNQLLLLQGAENRDRQ